MIGAGRGAMPNVSLAPATEIRDVPAQRLAPIRINLLPHREMRREQRKKDFVVLSGLVAAAAVVAAFAGGFAINQQIEAQQDRNAFIVAENARLDAQIAEIKTLREEIAALKARQAAVEALQSDRTVPVRLFSELARIAPDGLYVTRLRQDGNRVALAGHAQTNERVAELLRALSDASPWLQRPELGEIKEVSLPGAAPAGPAQPQAARKVYEFSLNALVRRPAPPAEARPGAPRTTSNGPAGPAAAAAPVQLGALR